MHQLLRLALPCLGLLALGLTSCSSTGPTQGKLAPGQYEWHPERSPSGPLLVVVSIDDQMAYAYRNGIQIAASTVSTGRPGKETPTGVFTILQRKVEHESSIYHGAEMPYMQRLTWSGIAMHAGELPGYPASAGCIRLPYEFSQKLYSIMQNGSTVVITQKNAPPSRSSKPASILLASRAAATENKAIPNPDAKVVWQPSKSPSGPISALISYRDLTLYIWRNGVQIGQAPIGINNPDGPLPEGVFLMLSGTDAPDPRFPGKALKPWSVLSLKGGSAQRDAVDEIRSQVVIPEEFIAKVGRVLTPGTILVTTKQSSTSSTRSASDFTIIAPGAR